MTKEHETTHANQHAGPRGRQADRALAEGFRPLGIPAVAAAAKAMARRPDTPQAIARRQRGDRDDG